MERIRKQEALGPHWSPIKNYLATSLQQEAQRPHCSPEKTVQFNKHMIIIMLIEGRKNPLFTL